MEKKLILSRSKEFFTTLQKNNAGYLKKERKNLKRTLVLMDVEVNKPKGKICNI